MDETDEERSWWRKFADFPLIALLLAGGLFIGAFAVAFQIGTRIPLAPDSLEGLAVRSVISLAVCIAVYKLAIARLGERPRDEMKIAGAPTSLGIGLAIGAGLMGVIVAVAAAFDVYNIVAPGGTEDLATNLIAAAIVPGILEEIFFRGILFRWVEEFAGSWAALILTSALFGLAHSGNPNATWFSSFTIAVEAGVLLGGAYMLTRNLWMPIGLHAAWNFVQGAVFDSPVSGIEQEGLVDARLSGPELLSGGTFGLEASVIALLIATAAGLYLILLAARRGNVRRPWWVHASR